MMKAIILLSMLTAALTLGCTATENLDTVVESAGLSGKACYMDGKKIETIFDAKGKEWPLSGQVTFTLGIKHEVCTFSAKAEPAPPSYQGIFAEGTVYDSHGRALRAYKLDQFTWHLNDAEWTKAPQGWTESPTSAAHLLPANRPSPTRQDDQAPRPLAQSLGAPTREQHSPTPKPTPTLTPIPTPVSPEARFLEIRYDASQTMNNRQDKLELNCRMGRKESGIKWSRTHNLQDHPENIIDTDGEMARIAYIEFEEIDRCDSAFEDLNWQVTVKTELVETGKAPNLTGFTIELRDGAGDLIATRQAECQGCDGYFKMAFAYADRPQDLFEKSAMILIYDNYTKGSQPTPTPEPAFLPGEKKATIPINPEEWDIESVGEVSYRQYDWVGYAYTKTPETMSVADLGHEIKDLQGKVWQIQTVKCRIGYGREEEARSEWQRYKCWLLLTNEQRAEEKNFTGYHINLEKPDGTVLGEGGWQPPDPDTYQAIGQRNFTITVDTDYKGPMVINIWDEYSE